MAEAVGGIAQGVGNVAAANVAADSAKEQARQQKEMEEKRLAEQSREFGITQPEQVRQFGETMGFQKGVQSAREKAYKEAIARGGEQMGAGETALMQSLSETNPELATQEKDISAGTARELQRGASQMGANLAAQGVRGGQAAILMNRGTGETATAAQEAINKLKYQNAAEREQAKRAYLAAKAGRGQAATLPAGAL